MDCGETATTPNLRSEVNGWRLRRNGTAVMVTNRAPDSRWFGAAPSCSRSSAAMPPRR
jgi:hypothetical protein